MNILYQRKNFNAANNNWCVYSHFDKNGIIEPYVFDAVKRINASGFKIILVSTSPSINEKCLQKLKKYVDVIAIRLNIGYDFGSYKLGIEFLLNNSIKLNKMLITNDSVFGPIFELESIIKYSDEFDLYGMTDSIDHAYHLQSYFIIFNSHVLKSKKFKSFWDSVDLLDANTPNFKNLIIQKYEVGGTQFFIKNGFKVGAAFGINKIIKNQLDRFLTKFELAKITPNVHLNKFSIGHNPTHNYWEDLINMGFPYIKRELLTTNPTNSSIENWPSVISQKKTYDPKLIIGALLNHFGSKDFLYTNQPTSHIAKLLSKTGLITLNLSQQFYKWRNLYSLPISKKFIFDSNYYLNINLDVKASIDNGAKINAIEHFIQHGYAENRPFKLNPVNAPRTIK